MAVPQEVKLARHAGDLDDDGHDTGGGSSDLDTIIAASAGQDIADALSGAAAPDAGNVFATVADLGGGSALTVEEVDGSPTDAAVTKVVFPNGTLGIVAHVATYTPPPVDVGIEVAIGDGVSAMATGSKGFIEVPFACAVTAARLQADVAGAIVVDVKKATYAGLPTTASICASAKPTIAATNQKSEDVGLSGWTTAVAAGSWLEFNVDSVTTIKRVTLSLTVRRT